MNKLISIIIPAYKEEKNIRPVYEKLKEVFLSLKYDLEVLFVNDGSPDNTQEEIEKVASEDERVHFIEFSRNFGKEAATSAGLANCHGDACLMFDADLQYPAELISEFIAKWEAGADVVVGVRESNKGEGFAKKVGSIVFYKIMNAIGETEITPRATDFRLIDRKVIEQFKKFTEINRMTRGLIDWMGFRRDYVYFNANERFAGEASYSKIKLLKLALNSFMSHSLLPLRITGYMGVIIIILSLPTGLFIFLGKYIFNNSFAESFSGPAQLAILLTFLVGVILASLGLIAMYIENIHNEVIDRPLYVERRNNFKK